MTEQVPKTGLLADAMRARQVAQAAANLAARNIEGPRAPTLYEARMAEQTKCDARGLGTSPRKLFSAEGVALCEDFVEQMQSMFHLGREIPIPDGSVRGFFIGASGDVNYEPVHTAHKKDSTEIYLCNDGMLRTKEGKCYPLLSNKTGEYEQFYPGCYRPEGCGFRRLSHIEGQVRIVRGDEIDPRKRHYETITVYPFEQQTLAESLAEIAEYAFAHGTARPMHVPA